MKTLVSLALLGLLAFGATSPAVAASFALDKDHSSVNFSVRHMMVSNVRGSFLDFDGTFTFAPEQPQSAQAQATIQVASIDTGNEKRDEHLRSPDFFAAEEYPTITFAATGVTMANETKGTLRGNLTIRDVTKPVELEFEILGQVTDPWGNTRVGFEVEGEIDRKDFGLVWNKALDGGGVVVGDKVEIEIEVEGILQK